MSANIEAMVREGSNALKAGRKDEARALLMKAVELDQYHEEAWLWLSAVVETPDDQRTCLENVLSINPGNQRALQGLKYLEQQLRGEKPASPPPPTSPPPAAAASKSSDAKQNAAFATSVEWSAPESDSRPTAPPGRPALELSEEDYDNWVSGLNLPTNGKPSAMPAPFMQDEDEEPDFDLSLSSTAPAAPVRNTAQMTPSKPPIDDLLDTTTEQEDELEDPFAELTALGESIDPKGKKAKPPKAEKPPKAPKTKAVKEPKAEEVPYDPLFPDIPPEIKVTRLPGTNERIPLPLILVLVLVLAANVVAILQLVQTVQSVLAP